MLEAQGLLPTVRGWLERIAKLRRFGLATGVAAVAAIALTPTSVAAAISPIRVNAGGPAYIDQASQAWSADTGASGGATYSTQAAIANTSDPTLYRTVRYGDFTYTFTVPAGPYSVTLKFAEIFFTVSNQRLFNVTINGALVLANFDIVAEAGGGNRALDKTFAVNAASGNITIQFSAGAANLPNVNAIEIVSAAPSVAVQVTPPTVSLGGGQSQAFTATVTNTSNTAVTWSRSPTVGTISTTGVYTAPSLVSTQQTVSVIATSIADPTKTATATVTLTPQTSGFSPIRVNAGGLAYTDAASRVWSADTGASGGVTYATAATVANTSDPALYQTERNGNFSYTFAVATGSYTVTLKFAEIYFTAANQRLFNVAINGTQVLANFDIAAEAGGGFRALDKTFSVNASTGAIVIQFSIGAANLPKVSAIEIVGTTTSSPVAVQVSPTAVSLGGGQTQAFTAIVTNTPNTAVTWSLSPAVGTVSTTGLYTAPSVVTTQQTVSVIATSVADPTRSAGAVVTLTPPPPSSQAAILINAGGPAYTDSIGQAWSADQYFSGGAAYTLGATPDIAGTADDFLHWTERFGNFAYNIPVTNGTYSVTLHFSEIYFTAANQRVFNVSAEGVQVISALDIWSRVGANTALPITFDVPVSDGVLNLDFVSVINNAKVSALEIRPSAGDPYLHVVIGAPAYVVDYDGNGSEVVALTGQDSHTHELGHHITSWVWTEGTTVLGTAANLSVPLSVGTHTLSLTIKDDNVPPRSLTDSVVVPVYPLNAVGGALAQYYPAGGIPVTTLIDALPSQPGFIEVLPTLRVDSVAGKVGGSAYTSGVVATLKADYAVTSSGTYQFTLSGGTATRFLLNGAPVTGPVALAVGTYSLEARFAVPDVTSLPAQVLVSFNGGAASLVPGTALRHNETLVKPFINSMPATGSAVGGESITISGFGFFPSAAVTVRWGSSVLPSSSMFITSTAISVTTPPGAGSVTVTIQTPNGTSNAATFTYTGGVPVAFNAPSGVATPPNPTQAAWGPDGRLYVGTISGQIVIYTFDDNYAVTGTQLIAGVSGLSNHMILGIAFNPFDPPSPVRVYVAHSLLFANGGTCFTGSSAYTGQVSRLTGPSFTSITPIVTGLPSSNHDHATNGLVFDNTGDLLIAQGGNTNAGVAGNCNIGQLPESPLSAAILKATVTKAGFNGSITYRSSANGQTQNDQNFGESVDVAPGVDVAVLAAGFRNPFDLVLTTEGRLYGTDNGPNEGFGPASTSLTTQAPDPSGGDEIVRLVQGNYYGHPNRSRGRYAPRETIYRGSTVPAILGQYTGPLALVDPSSDGIDEYRATTFNGAMRGNLLVQKLDGVLYRATLNAAGTAVTNVQTLATPGALDVVTGPGGAILSIDYNGSQVKVLKPSDLGAPAVAAYDIFPWRGRTDGQTPFVIGGTGFGAAGSTTVTIGGTPATLTSVSPRRIRGLIPAQANPNADLVDVVVQSAGQTSTITRAVRYVFNAGTGTGDWDTAPAVPQAIGEVAGGVIDGVMYMVGENNAATFAFDLATETWQTLAPRPFVGDHHAAEVIGSKLYLFGGLGGGSEGQVQIFNPATNAWSVGAPAPFASGSAASAFINGRVYLAGGITGSVTTNAAAVYDPVANTWTTIASMPVARNHTASGTDGLRFFIFGGRGPGSGDSNIVAEGFSDLQIYNPATNTWQCSCTRKSTLAPLPQKRGGMGKAAFFHGEFYVIGGETTPSGTGQVAGNVYNRVDVYNPTANSWRLDAPLPTARHGIFPLAYDNRIFVAGGGVQSGFSLSTVVEVLER